MGTSQYFNNYAAKNEQRIVEDLIVESIKIMGFDAYYLPNNNEVARDLLYGEDPIKKFGTAFQLEFYLSNVMDYDGDKELFSKFGLQIKNNVSLIVSKRSFTQRVPSLHRPREGDLIYVPFLNGTGELYEIKFVNHAKDFFMLGRKVPYFFELELEKFKYSQETINTGIPDIDVVISDDAYAIDLTVSAGSGTYIQQEIVYQSPDNTYANATTTAIVKNWNVPTQTLSVTNIFGEFADSNTIIGHTSNAQYTLSTYDPMDVNVRNEIYDNKYIQTSSNGVIDFSESNPFGSI